LLNFLAALGTGRIFRVRVLNGAQFSRIVAGWKAVLAVSLIESAYVDFQPTTTLFIKRDGISSNVASWK